ncbi:hypothetical protein AK812_SmicGene38406 [Symbiodinium microadriaticum]|uniref:Uncharacterized protein n=1 Tax=Symbiodinium microadriaticum TaxID=2951 RepID=A0A1Q9CDW1_SYMMI|nr:hypothetical protein AK812_SmicGene38406 [Symbiodinium microadriaticum]
MCDRNRSMCWFRILPPKAAHATGLTVSRTYQCKVTDVRLAGCCGRMMETYHDNHLAKVATGYGYGDIDPLQYDQVHPPAWSR